MTSFRVRAIPLGAAIQLSRRTLALGSRVSLRSVHQLMADWWAAPDGSPSPGDTSHPFTFALRILETQ